MDISTWNNILSELSSIMNYTITVLILQMGIIFLKQWNDDRKKQISDIIIIGYGLFYLFFSVGLGLAIYFSSRGVDPFIFYFDFMIVSILLRGAGGLVFSFVLEWMIIKKTRYLVTIILGVLVTITPLLIGTPIFIQVSNTLNLLLLGLPFIFTIFFIGKTSGSIRNKLYIAFVGFFLMGSGLSLESQNINNLIESFFTYPAFVMFPSKVVTIIGIICITYGFYGYSFFLEAEWKSNLISLFIIDNKTSKLLFKKEFLIKEIEREEIFAGGIAGIITTIKQFSQSKKEVDFINLGDYLILLDYGKTIITALLVKKSLQHAKFVVREITSKFEELFLGSLKDLEPSENEWLLEQITRDIIKV